MSTGNRPLSPHLEIYRPLMNMMLSITHRITGVGMALGALLLTYWLAAAAYGPEAYARAQALLGSWFGLLVLFGLTLALFYHLCNGIRHLVWDMGLGLEKESLRTSGLITVAAAVALTVIVWIAAFGAGGAG